MKIDDIQHWIEFSRAQMEQLPMFVVYDHPTDYPNDYVARLHLSLPESRPTSVVVTSPKLEALRDLLSSHGYVCLPRKDEDDPKIIETWLV